MNLVQQPSWNHIQKLPNPTWSNTKYLKPSLETIILICLAHWTSSLNRTPKPKLPGSSSSPGDVVKALPKSPKRSTGGQVSVMKTLEPAEAKATWKNYKKTTVFWGPWFEASKSYWPWFVEYMSNIRVKEGGMDGRFSRSKTKGHDSWYFRIWWQIPRDWIGWILQSIITHFEYCHLAIAEQSCQSCVTLMPLSVGWSLSCLWSLATD